ncbi:MULTISPECIES: hypothetical protein [unclassified Streptomyces]|uniref:hypothetical protein n=1 Tax=unclassified Streptomyces TaxID=2593676 RepID=UPI002DD79FC5|nr:MULTISPECIES: hypothetical protein [unclassified Streptomyces]WSA96764.1 hypothetical protein OIE63_38360 [Streptomyces sp. NBC_01795]WSB81180.1 hypothetical protein OHB04_39485 [Streptomyces sp. NBC_01775]WSS10611.1 hypothetical protein OG533_00790 [Streptomyces sp. NBC_01186]WSS39305.1 hypothetical protein OG220_00795 [Streptomyces sp. NBC_01187]
MFLTHHLPALDRLRAQPGPGVAELRTSHTGPDDDAADVLETGREFQAEHEALAALLSRRWGQAETVDLTGQLVATAEGRAVPEPERTLCGHVTELSVWSVQGRWTGIGVACWGESGPLQLLAAAGEEGRSRPWSPE